MAKVIIDITLVMSELIYDVQNKTYLTGRSRGDSKTYERVASMQSNDDDENMNEILRSFGNAWSHMKLKLSEYLVEEGSSSNNVLLDGEENISIRLSMPSNFDKQMKDSIAGVLHQYLVNYTIGDWFTITNKDDAATYIKLATENIDQLREALYKRVRPERKSHTAYETRAVETADPDNCNCL